MCQAQSVRFFIKGRGKMGYLNGSKKAPSAIDPNYAVWDVKNFMVMSWVVNSMEICMGYLNGSKKAPSAIDPNYAVWDVKNFMVMSWIVNSMETEISQGVCSSQLQKKYGMLKLHFSNMDNNSMLYDMKHKARETKQEDQTMMTYFFLIGNDKGIY